jgi:zinc protease
MGWKVPKIINGDLGPIEPFALSVLSGILDGNQNTRLNRILVKQKRISSGVGASYDADARGEQLFFISGTLLAGKKPELFESEVKKIISDIAKNGVQAAELERVKIAVTASQVYKRDSVFGQAMEIGSSEMSGLSWKKIDQVSEKILDVTAEQVQEVASKYFQDAQLTIGILDPQQMSKKNPLGSQPPFVVKH